MEYKNKFKYANKGRGTNSCIYGDLNMLEHHLKSDYMESKHVKTCKFCGAKILWSNCILQTNHVRKQLVTHSKHREISGTNFF